MRNIIYSDQKL